MKIIVFGATGGVGKHFVKMAVEAGHEVTAFARTPEKVTTENVHIIKGDVFNKAAVAQAIAGHEAVISCLGSNAGMKKSRDLEQMGMNVADGMEAAGVKRLVYCASAGVDGEIPGIAGKMMMKMLANPLADHRNALNYLLSKDVVYTIARPMGLKNNPIQLDYTEVFDGPPSGASSIPRASVAHFMVKALEDKKYENATVGLASKK